MKDRFAENNDVKGYNKLPGKVPMAPSSDCYDYYNSFTNADAGRLFILPALTLSASLALF